LSNTPNVALYSHQEGRHRCETGLFHRQRIQAHLPLIKRGRAKFLVRLEIYKRPRLAFFEGEVDEIMSDKGMVRIVTTIFGRPTPLELEYWQIEKL